MTTQLYLLRHGATAASGGSFVGSTDVELSGKGLDRLGGLLPVLQEVEQWYCSPMRRTRQTLQELADIGCVVENVVFDKRLQEIDFGCWEQKMFAEIAAADPELIKKWQEEYEQFVFPQGEAISAFIHRVHEMLDLFTGAGEQRIAVVTHGGVIRTMICLSLGIPVTSYLLFNVQPASLTILELYEQGGVLSALNL